MGLEASLLGGFRLVYDGGLVTAIHQPRQQALLAYVMLNASTPQTRQHLAFLFWPDSTERQAHANLRCTLHHLRRSFPPIDQYLQIGAQTLHWRPTAAFQLDVDAFEALIAAARRDIGKPAMHTTLQQAVDHYVGDLLPHCYDEWVIPIRERLHQRYLDALDQLVDQLEQSDDLHTAIGYAERRLHQDTLREISYRRLMRLHTLNGDRGSALRVYHDCAAMLERELGAEPGPGTRAAYAHLVSGDPLPPQPVGVADAGLPAGTVTFLFTDIEGSTRLWEQFPQIMPDALARHDTILRQAIAAEAGVVYKVIGDAVQGAFTTAPAACAAALAAQRALDGEAWGVVGAVPVRMALHTCAAVPTDGDYRTGALNRLGRLMGAVHGGQIVLSRATADLARDTLPPDVMLRDLGEHHLRDLRPEPVFQLVAPDLPRDFPPLRSLGAQADHLFLPPTVPPTMIALAPLVGRQREWTQLQAAWQTATTVEPRLVLLTGEAGIGKTRLAEELLDWAGRRGSATARTRAYAAEGRLAYALVADLLRASIYADRLALLDAVWLTEVARLLPEILATRHELPQPQPLTDGWQRRRLFEALARAVLLADQPLLLLIDDLQWADQETLEWLHYLLRFAPEAHLLIVGTARSEDIAPGHSLTTLLLDLRRSAQVTEIALGPLNVAETAALAQQIAATQLDQPILDQIYAQTEGTPLFIVETVRAAGEARGSELSDWASGAQSPIAQRQSLLPPAIYAIIQYRLAQLSAAARELVGLAAVVGRSFTFEIVAQAGGSDETTLIRSLDELWQRRIVREHGAHAYDFSHDRIRDVAYAEISPARRCLLHRRVAEALEQMHAGTALDTVSSQIASHYEQAGVPEQAVPYYRRAGLAAQQVYAHKEAIGHFTTALALLNRLPGGPGRDADELDLRLALAVSIEVTKGWAAPELQPIHDRAWALCQHAGTPEQRFSVLLALGSFHHLRGETDRHQALAEQLVELAEQWQTPVHLVPACMLLGGAHCMRGKLMLAQEQFERCTSLYSAQHHQVHVAYFGVDYGVLSLSWRSHTLWFLGYPDQALQRSREAVALAYDLTDPISQARALAYAAMLRQFRHESAAAQTEAEATLAPCTQHEIVYYGAWAAILLAWALAEEQPGAEGIARLRQALADFRATNSGLRWPYYLALLAEIYGSAGQPAAGLSILDEALAISAQHGERWWNAELHRLRGELLLAQGAPEADAEAAFQQALVITRAQGARSLELRAATSLARLWQKQGRAEQARPLLSDIYSWFTEGFDTPDLQMALALLKTLP